MRRTVAVLSLVAALIVAGPAGAATATAVTGGEGSTATQTSAYAGTHVSFEASGNAIADYAVGNATLLSDLRVESRESAEDGLVSVGASLSAVTGIQGSALSVAARTETRATVRTDGSASIAAHDNPDGVLTVSTGGESQYVVANLSDGASATADGDAQVEVTTADGTEGTFLVVGEGNVTVNDEGDVSAEVGAEGRLVFRAYPDGKTGDDDEQERLIADGEAAAEAYVMVEDGEVVTDAVNYSADTTVEARQSAESAVEVTVDRTVEQGTVVLTSVHEEAVGTASDLQVTVDGEAAASVSSYGELRSAVDGDGPAFLVRQGTSASASADVLVAVTHFSERTVAMSDGGADGTTTADGTSGDGTTSEADTAAADDPTTDASGDDGATDEPDATTSGGQPGFGVGVALVALLGAALLARRE